MCDHHWRQHSDQVLPEDLSISQQWARQRSLRVGPKRRTPADAGVLSFDLAGLVRPRVPGSAFCLPSPSSIRRAWPACPIGVEGLSGKSPELIAVAVVAQLLPMRTLP